MSEEYGSGGKFWSTKEAARVTVSCEESRSKSISLDSFPRRFFLTVSWQPRQAVPVVVLGLAHN